jgi:hypothetical protein
MTGQEEYEVTYCTINTLSVGIFSSTQQQQQQQQRQQQKRKILQLKQCMTFIEYIKYSPLISITRIPEKVIQTARGEVKR